MDYKAKKMEALRASELKQKGFSDEQIRSL